MIADAGDSELTPYSQGDPIWPFTVYKRRNEGELRGFRQLVSYAIADGESRPFPFEGKKSGSQRFIADVIRGKEKYSPITFMNITSVTMLNETSGESDDISQRARSLNPSTESKQTIRALVANFKNGDLQYGVRTAGSGNTVHIKRGDEQMK